MFLYIIRIKAQYFLDTMVKTLAKWPLLLTSQICVGKCYEVAFVVIQKLLPVGPPGTKGTLAGAGIVLSTLVRWESRTMGGGLEGW